MILQIGQGVKNMNNEEIVYRSLKYIESNIESKLSIDDVSFEFGYSKYHFCRMFKECMNISLGDYLIERRLVSAAKQILNGEKIIDAAMSYGYDTPSGFNRAFKNKLGYSPKILKALKLADTIFSKSGEIVMEVNELYQSLRNKMNEIFTDDELIEFDEAYSFACEVHKNQKRYSGEDYVTHPLNVCLILLDLKQDLSLVILGLLHDTLEKYDDKIFDEIKSCFGDKVALQVRHISEVNINDNLLEEDENIILVKLADRLHNMKTIEFIDKERWEKKAKETFSIFAPLAEKVGMQELKLELNHLSAQYIK